MPDPALANGLVSASLFSNFRMPYRQQLIISARLFFANKLRYGFQPVNEPRKAAVLIENAAIEVQDRPYLAPADDEVEVAISRAGVCSSDIERGFNHGAYHYPLVMGHELAGVVSATPHDASSFKEGDRVAIFPLLPCFDCVSCRRKTTLRAIHIMARRDGGFAIISTAVSNPMKLLDNVIWMMLHWLSRQQLLFTP